MPKTLLNPIKEITVDSNDIYRVNGKSLDIHLLDALFKPCHEVAGCRDIAKARIQSYEATKNLNSPISKYGSHVLEELLAVPSPNNNNSKLYIIRPTSLQSSLVLKNLKKASESVKKNSEHFLENFNVEKYLRDELGEDNYLELGRSTKFFSKDFGKSKEMRFLFGDENAQKYGELIHKTSGTIDFSISTVDQGYIMKHKKPFARSLYIFPLSRGSHLTGYSSLDNPTSIRGIANAKLGGY
ncbi:MAG TPA: hypothetical protein VEC16_04595 [Alphaproteobacteria bacterium]|nr:hypothetical protein [Alphaproteobacteria bacterium]